MPAFQPRRTLATRVKPFVLTVCPDFGRRLSGKIQPNGLSILIAIKNDVLSTHSYGGLGREHIITDVSLSLKHDKPLATVHHASSVREETVVIVVD
jgi:hypothetical protein